MARVRMTKEEMRAYRQMTQEEREKFDAKLRQKKAAARRVVVEDELDIGVLLDEHSSEKHGKKDSFVGEKEEKEDKLFNPTQDKKAEEGKAESPVAFKAENFRTYYGMEKKHQADELSEEETQRRKLKEKKEIYINFLIDGTYSFTKLFAAIYYVLSDTVTAIQKEIKRSDGFRIYYGLTVLHEKGEAVSFDGKFFTKDTGALLEEIKKIRFRDGAEDGLEDINGGIETALRVLANHTPEFANRGLIFLTDTKCNNMRVDFTNLKDMEYNSLRFVVGYLFDPSYRGEFNIVDGDGNKAANGKNHPFYMSIESLLNGDTADGMKAIIESILRMVSVWITG